MNKTRLEAFIASQGRDSILARAVGSDWKGKVSPILYLIAILAAFPARRVSHAIYVAVALVWLVPDRRIERALSSSKS